MQVKLFSLNIWNLNNDYRSRMKELDTYLRVSKPDIVCLQEVSVEPKTGRPQTDNLTSIDGNLSQQYSSQGKWGDREEGLATFSRLPLLAFESFMLPDATKDMQRRVQFSVLGLGSEKLVIGNTHLAYHLDSETGRIQQCMAIKRHVSEIRQRYGTENIVLAGDLNSTPDSTPIGILASDELELVDAFDNSTAREISYSFPANSPYMNKELWPDRWIDYVFLSRRMKVQSRNLVLNGSDHGPFVSDHAALEVVFEPA